MTRHVARLMRKECCQGKKQLTLALVGLQAYYARAARVADPITQDVNNLHCSQCKYPKASAKELDEQRQDVDNKSELNCATRCDMTDCATRCDLEDDDADCATRCDMVEDDDAVYATRCDLEDDDAAFANKTRCDHMAAWS